MSAAQVDASGMRRLSPMAGEIGPSTAADTTLTMSSVPMGESVSCSTWIFRISKRNTA